MLRLSQVELGNVRRRLLLILEGHVEHFHGFERIASHNQIAQSRVWTERRTDGYRSVG